MRSENSNDTSVSIIVGEFPDCPRNCFLQSTVSYGVKIYLKEGDNLGDVGVTD